MYHGCFFCESIWMGGGERGEGKAPSLPLPLD